MTVVSNGSGLEAGLELVLISEVKDSDIDDFSVLADSVGQYVVKTVITPPEVVVIVVTIAVVVVSVQECSPQNVVVTTVVSNDSTVVVLACKGAVSASDVTGIPTAAIVYVCH